MNYFKLCGIIVTGLLVVSCQPRYTKNETILRAESLLFSATDSAFRLLSSVQHPEKLPIADYAAWCLNYTHAKYKLHKVITSDSLIRIPVNYYKHSKLKIQIGTTYYLLGCINQNLHKNKDAMEAFKQAEDILMETNEDKLKGLVDFNMGYICMQDELSNQSLTYFRKSLKYFYLSKDKIYQAYAYRAISDMYFELDYPFDSVMHFSDLALKLSKEARDSVNYYRILSRQGELLYNKDYKRAK